MKRACSVAGPFVAFALALSAAGCTGKHNVIENEEPSTSAPRVLSTVRMGDPAASSQLLSGFYAIENNAWRWTAGAFSILLQTPPGATQNGAVLNFALTIPDVITRQLGGVKLTASIGGKTLKTEDYKAPGVYTFKADVPSAMFTGDATRVDFTVDKTLPPGIDKRQLGIIAGSAGLVQK